MAKSSHIPNKRQVILDITWRQYVLLELRNFIGFVVTHAEPCSAYVNENLQHESTQNSPFHSCMNKQFPVDVSVKRSLFLIEQYT